MENRFPKNVRQIGNVSDTPKIYVEDYVDTFLSQICENADEEPVGAFLVGRIVKTDDQELVYISGAVRMEEIETDGMDVVITRETWNKAREDCSEYFGGKEMLGWFISLPGYPAVLNSNLRRLHEQYFGKNGTILILKEPTGTDELFFAHKYGELMPMGGHYIYYEKNPAMQNYMVSARKQIGVTPSEAVEDKAAKEFRNIVKERFEFQEQKRNSRFMYVASVFLVLVVLVMGVTTINNYDKMRSVQSSVEDIKESVARNAERSGTEETTEASASGDSVTAMIEGENPSEEDSTAQPGNENQGEGDDGEASGGTSGDLNGEQTDIAGNTATSTIQEMSEDIYIVQKGDTLAKISKRVYGDIGHVDAICRMNGLEDGNLIFIGQKLLLP
ncbi:MAG: LysM peptidoglycan-binding domain-containing protein [Bariatricus sp.]